MTAWFYTLELIENRKAKTYRGDAEKAKIGEG
jgi:hypothetical protein